MTGLTDDPTDGEPTAAPPVVAVMVTHDAGPWLDEALASLAAQDYPNLSVLVLDTASEEDPTGRIAAVLPAAFVRRLPTNVGFGPAANDVLDVVEGASHYVFLHDDVALEPDTIRLLVEEAYRSNAGAVAPKLVEWDDPIRLLSVGMTADKTGVATAFGRGELDQEQHDAVRDVFVAPGACQLVRADLFATLGGFDPEMPMFGEDLDLSWRVQLAGARVVVAPSARARHLEATVADLRPLDPEIAPFESDGRDAAREASRRAAIARLRLRHRVRTILKSYGPLALLLVVPQAFAVMLVEAAATGRRSWGALLAAWRFNVGGGHGLRDARKAAQSVRLVRDRDLRQLQTRGGTRLAAVVRGGLAVEERAIGVGAAGRHLAGAVTSGGLRLTLTVWCSLLVLIAIGSRHLLGGPLPAVGQFVPFPGDAVDALRMYVAGWQPAGLGGSAPPPFALFLLGAGSAVLLGAEQLLQKLLVLGMLPLGIVGMHRLTAPLGSWRARLLAAVLYAAVPLPYDAIARGRWATLVAYGVMPAIVGRLLRASGLPPFGAPAAVEDGARITRRRRRSGPRTPADAVEALLGAEAGTMSAIDTEELRVAAIVVAGRPDDTGALDDAGPGATPPPVVRHPGTFLAQAIAASIVLALAAALAPPVATVTLAAGLGLAVGGLVSGAAGAGLRSFALACASVAGAAVLLVPWPFDLVIPGAPLSGVIGIGLPASDGPSWGDLLRLHIGAIPVGALSWGLMGAAALPLVVGRRWRLDWAARLWVMAVVVWLIAWAAGRGWLGVAPPALDVLLAPVAVALVLCAALGQSAFEVDLPGYRFGWRQVASLVAAAAGAAATVPLLVNAVDGRWGAPPRDFGGLLSWMPEQVGEGDFRVLWVGAPDSLPLDGWRVTDALAYGTSRNGPPDALSLWPGSDDGATGLLADALAVARRGETTRLGRILGPLGVRYVAVPLRPSPATRGYDGHPPPVGVLDALRGQVDLELVQTDDTLVLFENAAWTPIRASAGASVLRPGSPILRSRGDVPDGEVTVAEPYSSRWRLEVEGERASHAKSGGWANSFNTAVAGEGRLVYRTPPQRYPVLLLQLALWIAAIRSVFRAARARTRLLAAADADREPEVSPT